MIRVLHLRSTDRVCGPGKTILESCAWIDAQRFSLSVGLLSSLAKAENPFWRSAKERGVDISLVASDSRFSTDQIRQIVQLVRDKDIDIIHSHEYKTDILGLLAARKAGVPIVTTLHGWISNSWRSKAYLWLGKQVLRWFDHVIAVSPAIRREAARCGVRPDRLSLIHNAIVIENYASAATTRGYLRNKFSISPNAKIIGKVGRISPEKGQKDFVRAATRILQQRDDVEFVLVGDGPDQEAVQELARASGHEDHFHFTGHIQDVRPVFADMDIMALTSYTEGFPNVVLEALCMDVAVLATDVGGVADIVEDRVTGRLVAAGDVDGITGALLEMLENPDETRQMVRNGRAVVERRFSFAERMKKVEAVYTSVVSS